YAADGRTAWTPNNCCYRGVPLAQADISPVSSDERPIDKAPGFKSWTVTDMVRDWLADPASNFGLLLDGDATTPENHYRNFASTEYDDASLRPRLTIAFVAGDATPPLVAIRAPVSSRTVSGTVSLTAAARDNVGVAGVQFEMNGTPIG